MLISDRPLQIESAFNTLGVLCYLKRKLTNQAKLFIIMGFKYEIILSTLSKRNIPYCYRGSNVALMEQLSPLITCAVQSTQCIFILYEQSYCIFMTPFPPVIQ